MGGLAGNVDEDHDVTFFLFDVIHKLPETATARRSKKIISVWNGGRKACLIMMFSLGIRKNAKLSVYFMIIEPVESVDCT